MGSLNRPVYITTFCKVTCNFAVYYRSQSGWGPGARGTNLCVKATLPDNNHVDALTIITLTTLF